MPTATSAPKPLANSPIDLFRVLVQLIFFARLVGDEGVGADKLDTTYKEGGDSIAQSLAMAAQHEETRTKLEALSKDIISGKTASPYTDLRLTMGPVIVCTANGSTQSDQALSNSIAQFGDGIGPSV